MNDVPMTVPLDRDDRRWSAFLDALVTRRAIRVFARRPIEPEDVHDVIDAGLLAPTSSNLQPFELVWVRSPDARDRLVHACMSQPAAATAAELIVCVARWDRCEETRRELLLHLAGGHADDRERFYYERLARWSYDVGPLGLFGRARRVLSAPLRLAFALPRGPTSRADVRAWALKSSALVCESLMLAASAKGLDTCPMEGADAIRVGKILALPAAQWKKTWDLTMVIALGHRAPSVTVAPRWRRARSTLARQI